MIELYLVPLLGIYKVSKKKSLWLISVILIIWVVKHKEITISSLFEALTLLMLPTALISSWSNVKLNEKYYVLQLLLLESVLLKFFTTENVIIFYITFELSLIPLYLIIKIKLINKISNNRATTLLFMYTLIGSLLILSGTIGLILLMKDIEITNIIELNKINGLLFVLLFVGLSIKIPIVPFHIWLFRAHAEAPVAVSIILSSVILKIATYGLYKLVYYVLWETTVFIIGILEIVLVISLIYTSLSATRQHDIKALVAISSISHQAIVIIGIFSSVILMITDNNKLGLLGVVLLSLGHGLVSPALFTLTGSVLYDRYHSRIINYYKGLNKSIPLFGALILVVTLINLGIPLTLNFYGEMLSVISIVKSNITVGLIATVTIILSAWYSMLLWSKLNLGSNSIGLYFSFDVNRREFVLIQYILIIVIVTGLIPNLLIKTI